MAVKYIVEVQSVRLTIWLDELCMLVGIQVLSLGSCVGFDIFTRKWENRMSNSILFSKQGS